MSKKGLGRGFASLIPTDLLDESFDPTATQDETVSQLKELSLTTITPDPEQPRRHFDAAALEELADSIRIHGVLQPIIVIPSGDTYLIVAGERRYRAAKKAGLSTIPALVRSLDSQHKLELSLIENLQRRDLNALETATAYQKLKDQFNLTLEQIGKRVGNKSVSAISNTLRLLRLPKFVQEAIAEGIVTEGQARPLIGHDEDLIRSVLPRIINEEWSARRIEQFIVTVKQQPHGKSAVAITPEHHSTQQAIEKHLGAPVRIRTTQKGSGSIIIPFKDASELERLNKLLSD